MAAALRPRQARRAHHRPDLPRGSRICRQPSGALVAAIDIAAYGDPTEWVAHEFEHLIEQLDGVDLHALERRGQGAWKSGNQMFETERAVSVGRRVWREMREPAITARIAEPAAADADAAVAVEPALR